MVQFFQKGPSRKSLLTEALGQALGKSLGEFTGNYFANKSLERVLNDKSLQDKPPSERISALETALNPHGEYGERLFQKRIGIEQQRINENQERLRNESANQDKTTAANLWQHLFPDQEMPQGISSEQVIGLSKLKSAHDIAQTRMQNTKPLGGLSGQKVPEEVTNAIGQVLKNNPGKNSDQLAQAFDEAGVPRAYSNSYIENRRRQDEASPKERLEIHKLSADISKKLSDESDSSRKRLKSFEVMENKLKTGKLDPKSFKNLFANALSGTFLEGLLRDPESEEFKAASFNVYEGLKNTFGVRLSDADLKLASSKVPDITKSPEANKKIIEFLKFFDKINVEKQKIASEVLKENRGFRPIDFEQQVNDRMESKFGNEAERVTKEAADVDKKGKVSTDIALEFIRRANGNKEEAKRLALEAGYEL